MLDYSNASIQFITFTHENDSFSLELNTTNHNIVINDTNIVDFVKSHEKVFITFVTFNNSTTYNSTIYVRVKYQIYFTVHVVTLSIGFSICVLELILGLIAMKAIMNKIHRIKKEKKLLSLKEIEKEVLHK